MTIAQDESRMLRKQYRLSPHHERRVEELRVLLGLDSDAALIRRVVDTFDPDALDAPECELVKYTAKNLIEHIEDLNVDIERTLERAQAACKQLNDPAWIETIREKTWRKADGDSAIVAGLAQTIRIDSSGRREILKQHDLTEHL